MDHLQVRATGMPTLSPDSGAITKSYGHLLDVRTAVPNDAAKFAANKASLPCLLAKKGRAAGSYGFNSRTQMPRVWIFGRSA
jgi:hypothetical protein